MIGHVITFTLGVLFAVAFALGGVTQPGTIVGFLDFTGDWKPGVMLVMGGAVGVTFVIYRLSFMRASPLLAPKFKVPTRRDIDPRLIGGAVLFGAGWGLIGFCPGPALASIATGSVPLLVWLGAVVGGMLLFKVWSRARQARQARADLQARPMQPITAP